MRLRTPLVITAATVALVAGSALPAFAANSGNTTATFSLTGGSLGITSASSAALTGAFTGVALQHITGSLGGVTVTDARGGTSGWIASAASTTFTGSGLSTSTDVQYTAGTATPTGTVTATDAAKETIASVADVVTASGVSGNNAATWTPSVDVTMPAGALAGSYTGTVTTSVA